jgi:MerR family transcriptional regulator, redox-sensitive transcriptional activator SoxR
VSAGTRRVRFDLDRLHMPPTRPSLTIGGIARRAGVRASRVRYYEQVGVLPPPERAGGQRRYAEDVVHRLAIIQVGQRAGLSLEEIRDLTRSAGEGIRALAHRKLPDIEALSSVHRPSSGGSRSRSRATVPVSTCVGFRRSHARPAVRRHGAEHPHCRSASLIGFTLAR